MVKSLSFRNVLFTGTEIRLDISIFIFFYTFILTNTCYSPGLQHLCGSAFAQLARTSCTKEDFRASASVEHHKGQSKHGKVSVLGGMGSSGKAPKLVRLHAAHVLSMDVVVSTGLEMGSHSADCWKHVLRWE